MGDLGIPELLIILAIVIVLFGPSRLTGVAKSLGEGIREFRHSVRDETLTTASQEAPASTHAEAAESAMMPDELSAQRSAGE